MLRPISGDPDRTWRRWWLWWALLCLPLAALAVVVLGVSAVAASIMPAMLVGTALQASALAGRADVATRQAVMACLRAAGAAAVMGPALAVLGAVEGRLALAAVLLMVLTCPPSVQWLSTQLMPGRATGGSRRAGEAPRSAEAVARDDHRSHLLRRALLAEPVEGLDDVALCRAWRRSYVLLSQAHTNGARAEYVALRQQYLDEMERRNAAALQSWLRSGPRAAGGPERYLVPGAKRSDGTSAG